MAWQWQDDQWWRHSSWSWSEAGHDWQLSASWHSWWRDPESDRLDDERPRQESPGRPRYLGAFFGGPREGWVVDNHPRPGQIRGVSGSPLEKFPPSQVFQLDIPMNLKEAGRWWSECKEAVSAAGDHLHISYRAKRWSPKGPGWWTLTVTGPGGQEVLESCLRNLFRWCPELDIDAVELPQCGSEFPTKDVLDAFGRVKESMLQPLEGLTLVDSSQLQVTVVGADTSVLRLSGPGVAQTLKLHYWKKKRKKSRRRLSRRRRLCRHRARHRSWWHRSRRHRRPRRQCRPDPKSRKSSG